MYVLFLILIIKKNVFLQYVRKLLAYTEHKCAVVTVNDFLKAILLFLPTGFVVDLKDLIFGLSKLAEKNH